MSDELDLLKERAKIMGVSFHPSIGVASLKDKIAEASAGSSKPSIPTDVPLGETIAERNTRMRREANKLVRISLTCMNPAKSTWPGEVITFRNNAIGTIRKFIPFEAEDGYHVPQVILGILQERKFQTFYVVKAENGQRVKRSKLAKEFAIEILPDLSVDELKALAARQALAEGKGV